MEIIIVIAAGFIAVNAGAGNVEPRNLRVVPWQQILLNFLGQFEGTDKLAAVAQTIDQNTMTLQYFETLKDMGANPSTKYIFPMEFSSFIENFVKGKEG